MPPVGVALHIQASAWHAQHLGPQLAAAGTTFEDVLLATMQRYGYATAPYGSSEWAQRPSYIMAFEVRGQALAGSFRRIPHDSPLRCTDAQLRVAPDNALVVMPSLTILSCLTQVYIP